MKEDAVEINGEHSERLKRAVLRPLSSTSRIYYAFMLFLLIIIAWGGYAYITQLRNGLIVTGMRDVTFWGIYIVNFVFFIGISHAGTLISAILRVSKATWRTSITRMAEVITVVALLIGMSMPFIDMGRPDRFLYLIIYGRLMSPLIWDILSITTYLTGSLIYLYLPLIPDLALVRDRLGTDAPAIKRKFYTLLAAGWRNTPEQRNRLDRGIRIMAVIIIPIAISVHTVVSWVFAMTLRPGWNSTIFGPYFVVGAIFSGIASILIVMAIFRKLFHLEEYITEKHFRYLGYLLMTLLLLYAYFTLSEYLTIGYKLKLEEKELLAQLMLGKSAIWFWSFIVMGIVVPGILIVLRKMRIVTRIVIAAVLINIAMWVKRFMIVLTTLEIPLMPFEFGVYKPTWVEISITLAAFAAFVFIFAVFAKIFPIISVWEVSGEHEVKQAVEPVSAGNVPRVFGRLRRSDS
ncbi:MAG: polysulfide reductase NrfD [Actinobacteria bacterium]|nr:polysulfide reductase NrfD [Actinomycetota bacterium]